ncbi:MAG: peptidylprolyl isomerase [Candidatus Thiothrix singaporensis]|uniref:peptidylprolyl isomerase n=1 Tax=Candidatus Thiothrix singaporensis TaxID=2799669 RepID=A0A7L6AX65_9GAMM|nr:MAG: peptidylprolyl isomerase [Candidatus Thiothrix singaporensis]
MASPNKISAGKVVQFSYFITDESGKVVEQVDLPLNMVFMMHNRLYDSVEQALVGCGAGDQVAADVPPTVGSWGEPDPSLIFTEATDNVPPPFRRVGEEVQFQNESGDTKTFRITSVTRESVTLDGNHPFAGQTMKFHVKVLAVRDATAEEMRYGIPSGAPGADPGATMH